MDQAHKNMKKDIQKMFTRRLTGFQGEGRPDYWERLKMLKMYSLERRREQYLAIYAWKIINNYVPNPGLKITNNQRTGIHVSKFEIEHRLPGWLGKIKKNSTLLKCAVIFNSLPKYLRTEGIAENPLKFKRELDKFLMNIPDQPTIPGRSRSANSNSLTDQIVIYSINTSFPIGS